MSSDPRLSGRLAKMSPEERRRLLARLMEEKSQKTQFFELSFPQQRLWFLDQVEGDGQHYRIHQAFETSGDLRPQILERALRALVQRHEVLRTTFLVHDGKPLQAVAPHGSSRLPVVDLSALGSEEGRGAARDLVRRALRQPFDLKRGPLLRSFLFRFGRRRHRLLVDMHHIVSDGWSLGIVARDLGALYRAFAEGNDASPLPPLQAQYRDFARQQRQSLDGEALERGLAYWSEKLAGAPGLLELPTDRPRPAVQSFRGALHPLRLPQELRLGVEKLARERQVSPFMALEAVFTVLLGRIARRRDVLVGIPIANRTRAEFEALIGFFVNSLVLRVQLSGDGRPLSFSALLEQVRETTLEAYDHQDVPFDRLVEALQPERNRSHAPLAQVYFQLLATPTPSLDLPAVTLKPRIFDPGVSVFDLNFQLEPAPEGGLRGIFQYATDLFDQATVARFGGHFQHLLASALEAPEADCDTLTLLSPAERQQLAQEFNPSPTLAPPAPEATLHRGFEAQARRRPEAAAVTLADESLSYGALDQAANRLAHRLRALGVGPEVPVGVSMERSLDLPVAILGILKAGGAYLPLDPVHPPGRLAYVLEDAGPPVVVCDRGQATALRQAFTGQEPPFFLELEDAQEQAVPAEQVTGPPPVVVGADNLAYIIYTSGSTGRPKGTLIRHRNVLRLFTATDAWFGFREDDVWTLFHSFAFDFSVWEIWGALLYGGRVVVVPTTVSRSPKEFRELLATEGVTVLNQTPSAFRQLVRADQQRQGARDLALRFVIFGGEALELGSLEPWFQRHGDGGGEMDGRGPRLINMYGITETTVHVTYRQILAADLAASHRSPVGWAIPDLTLYAVDDRLEPVPLGVPGELLVGGAGVASGYLGRPALTAQRFIPDPFSQRPGARLYKSGDLARVLMDPRKGQEVEFLGRIDHQVQLRGFRIELGEIESALIEPNIRQLGIREAVVLLHGEAPDQQLVAYVVTAADSSSLDIPALRAALKERLPEYMVPGRFVPLESLPLTANGKLDRKALPEPTVATVPTVEAPRIEADGLKAAAVATPRAELGRTLARIWSEVLGVPRVGLDDNFFDLGGHSLRMVEVQDRLAKDLGIEVSVVELFEHATVRALVEHLRPAREAAHRQGISASGAVTDRDARDIAIVAMTGRFPGAADVETFWRHLEEGVEGISFFGDGEVESSPLMPAQLQHPNFVKAGGVIEGAEEFDAGLFGFTPREAELLDPQQRLFLEASWEALERAGTDPRRYPGRIGVFAGVGMNAYFPLNLMTNPELVASAGGFQMMVANDKDHLPTRVSYQLGLRGPSVNVQTACSTSLVAVHLACRALRQGECDMALAGGVSIRLPQKTGYLHQTGMILSPDGHCRAFDAEAKGVVGGNGLGVVVLKPLVKALADGDRVAAVIRGTAVNNDGAAKVGYTAPGVSGQAEVIEAALADAGVDPETLGYVEAHGTGTELGDPIEVAALTRVYRKSTERRGYCGLGSVKSNIGHLDAAAGVTGLIKAALSLEHGRLVPSLHFHEPNPKLELETSPFFVVTEAVPWPPTEDETHPRRAAVSSFGIGGTNAHVVLEAAPGGAPVESGPSPRRSQLVLLSAATPEALEAATERLERGLGEGGDNAATPLADVAYTLALGRGQLAFRRALVVQSNTDAATLPAAVGEAREGKRIQTGEVTAQEATAVFLFPGQGAQVPGMGADVYASEPEYRRWVDRCADLFQPHLGRDLRDLLLGRDGGPEAAEDLRRTSLAQPALFTVGYALARLWMHWGVEPAAMLGHSIGEFVAACLAGVVSLEDAVTLVALRGRVMEAMEPGSMLTVPLSEVEVVPYLEESGEARLAVAALNAPAMTVVSGPTAAIEALAERLEAKEEGPLELRRLHTSHAFHSPMMAAAAEEFEAAVGRMELRPAALPYLSNVTGSWIGAEGADPTDPSYWRRHIEGTVRFSESAVRLLEDPAHVFVELGPGRTLQSLLRQQGEAWTRDGGRQAVGTLAGPNQAEEDPLLTSLGRLWCHGLTVDWRAFYSGESRRKALLPTYPFERRRYWVEPGRVEDSRPVGKVADVGRWFSVPSWIRTGPVLPSPPDPVASGAPPWLLFLDETDEDLDALAATLRSWGIGSTVVRPGGAGSGLVEAGDGTFHLDPEDEEAYADLLATLAHREGLPGHLVHAWGAAASSPTEGALDRGDLARGYSSVLHLVRALVARNEDKDGGEERVLTALTRDALTVRPGEPTSPARATVLGILTVTQQEAPQLACRMVDLPPSGSSCSDPAAAVLLSEACRSAPEEGEWVVAYRDGRRWRRSFEQVILPPVAEGEGSLYLTREGVYLVTGGLGGVGFVLARLLAREARARLALLSRTPMPPREAWTTLRDSDSGVSQRIRRVLELEALGASVQIVTADVADRAALAAAVAEVESHFGPLNGVIHAAGLSGEAAFRLLSQTDDAVSEAQFRPKIDGLLALEAVLGDRPMDFRMITSSISTILGGLGFAAYAAANLAVDAYVEGRGPDRWERRWLTVDWDGWQLDEKSGQVELALNPEEGEEVIRRLLATAAVTDESRWIISTGDLSRRMERWLYIEALRRAAAVHREEAGRRHSRSHLGGNFVAPRNSAEESLAGIWRDLLGIEQIGVHDDFFELGGHSLLVTQLLGRIRDTLGQDLEMRTVFTHPTIAELAAEVTAEAEGVGAGGEIPLIAPVPRDGAMRLSFAQERMWFLYRLEPEGVAYNLPAAIRLEGPLDSDALRRSFDAIAQRHETLRTFFVEEGGVGFQKIEAVRRYPLPVVDLSTLTAGEREEEVLRLVYRGSARPFRLDKGPLLRSTLLRLAPREHIFFTVGHHIISDGWSGPIFVRELAHFYASLVGVGGERGESSLPELPIQYADYAEWQREYVQGEVLETQLAYWKERLGEPPAPLGLPYDRPRPRDGSAPAGRFSFEVPESVVASLRQRGQRRGATLFMVIMAAFQVLLHRYTGATDVAVGAPIANRHRSGTENLVGFFINTLVLRTDLSGDPNFRELLSRVRELTLGAYAHQDLPFDEVVKRLRAHRGGAVQPLFETMMAFNHEPPPSPELEGLALSLLDLDQRDTQAMFDLVVGVTDTGAEMSFSVEFNRALFDGTTVRRMMANWKTLLHGLAEGVPGTPLSRLPLLSAAERQVVVFETSPLAASCSELQRELSALLRPEVAAAAAAGAGDTRLFVLSAQEVLVPLGCVGSAWVEMPEGLEPIQAAAALPNCLEGIVDPGRLLTTTVRLRRRADGRLVLQEVEPSGQHGEVPEGMWRELAERLPGKKRSLEPAPEAPAEGSAAQVDSEAEALWRQVSRRRSRLSDKKQTLLTRRLRGKRRRSTAPPSAATPLSEFAVGDHLVNIQPAGDGPPFFCVHAIAGDVTHYMALADHLGFERPFYGLQALGVDGRSAPLERVEAMADTYIAALRRQDSTGPYLLGGWSMGAVVAYEMACRLEQEGERVDLLVLLEPSLPGGDGGDNGDSLEVALRLSDEELIRRLVADLESLLGGPMEVSVEEILHLDREAQMEHLLRQVKRVNPALTDLDRALSPALFKVYRTHVEALRCYRPGPYHGRVALFAAKERVQEFATRSVEHWRRLIAGSLDLVEIPGNHTSMLQEPNVVRLAAELRACLQGVEVAR